MPCYEHVGDRGHSAYLLTRAHFRYYHGYWESKPLNTIKQVVANNTRRFPRQVHFSTTVFRITQKAEAIAQPDMPLLCRYAAEYCPQLELIQIIEATSISTDPQQLAMLQQLFPQIRKRDIDRKTQDQR